MKRVLFYLSFLTLILATSCELIQPTTDFTPDKSDPSGNLLIINNSNEQLVLYKDQVVIKKIPASATDFLVNIPNESGSTVELDLYLWSDVSADVNNPDPTLAFKRWMVPLSPTDAVETRATWHISGATQYVDVATLNLSYFGGTDNFVDVYLNGRTGAKIASLKPGDQYRKVGVDYGNYTLHYLYWFSDQNSTTAFEEKGWIEKQTINGEEKDIWLILNENRKDITMTIPHLGSAASQGTRYAGVEIRNYAGEPVQVFVDDKLIESVCYLEEGNTRNLSTLDVDGVYTFYLPISAENDSSKLFRLKAQTLTTVQVVETIDLDLQADKVASWWIDGEADPIGVQVLNEKPVIFSITTN
jgi:hypothetical protein